MDRPPACKMVEVRTGNRKFIWSGLRVMNLTCKIKCVVLSNPFTSYYYAHMLVWYHEWPPQIPCTINSRSCQAGHYYAKLDYQRAIANFWLPDTHHLITTEHNASDKHDYRYSGYFRRTSPKSSVPKDLAKDTRLREHGKATRTASTVDACSSSASGLPSRTRVPGPDRPTTC